MLQHCLVQTVENASDADGSDSPGHFTGPSLLWLSVFLNPSELSGKLRCQSQISGLPAVNTTPHSAAFRGLGTCYVQYVWLDSGVQNWNRVGCGQCCAEIGLPYELRRCPCQLRMVFTFLKTHSSPQLVVALFWSFLTFTHLTSCFFTNEKKGTCATDIFRSRSLSVPSRRTLWSSAVPERSPGLAVCAGLNQSGSWWAQVHLSQMLICRAQLWGQRRFTCIWCKITWAGMPSPSCLGFCSRPRERCDTSGRAKCPFAPPPRSGGSHSCG